MSDACQAHFNGLKAVYPNCKPLMCYFHMRDNCKTHVKCIDSNDIQEKIMSDINYIHYATTPEQYINSHWYTMQRWDKFIAENQKGVQKFKDYFTKQWIYSSFGV